MSPVGILLAHEEEEVNSINSWVNLAVEFEEAGFKVILEDSIEYKQISSAYS